MAHRKFQMVGERVTLSKKWSQAVAHAEKKGQFQVDGAVALNITPQGYPGARQKSKGAFEVDKQLPKLDPTPRRVREGEVSHLDQWLPFQKRSKKGGKR